MKPFGCLVAGAISLVLTTVSAFADNIGTMTQEIRGGNIITGFTGVGEFTSNNVSCTGSLIGPDIFLTAAHCLVRKTSPQVKSGGGSFRIFYHIPGIGRQQVYRGPANWYAYTGFDPNTEKFPFVNPDIAVIRISGRFAAPGYTTDYTDFLRLYADSKKRLNYVPVRGQYIPYENRYLAVYGAGIYTYSGKSDNLLRTLMFKVENVEENHIVIDTRKKAGTCLGDSGGPIMYSLELDTGDVPLVAGVLSGADSSGNCSDNFIFHDDAFYSRTNWKKLESVMLAAGVRCTVFTAGDVSYRRCFDLPFVNDVAYEGLDQGTAAAIVAAVVLP